MNDSVDVEAVRTRLDFSQDQLGALLGAHGQTVSKWERRLLRPTAWQRAMLEQFEIVAEVKPAVGQEALAALKTEGAPSGLFVLLAAARFFSRRQLSDGLSHG